jgi:hypothetical protein
MCDFLRDDPAEAVDHDVAAMVRDLTPNVLQGAIPRDQ